MEILLITATTDVTLREIFLGIVAIVGVITNVITALQSKKKNTIDIKAIETEILQKLQNLYGKMIADLQNEVEKLKAENLESGKQKRVIYGSKAKIVRIVRNTQCKDNCPVKEAVEKYLEKELENESSND